MLVGPSLMALPALVLLGLAVAIGPIRARPILPAIAAAAFALTLTLGLPLLAFRALAAETLVKTLAAVLALRLAFAGCLLACSLLAGLS